MNYSIPSALIFTFFWVLCLNAQTDRWQQAISYEMEIDVDVETHRFAGKQKLTYFNNSPDTLRRVFYHLYFNAFQPGSMMDVRSRTIADPDRRVRDRIFYLKPNEIGYHKIESLQQDGVPVEYEVEGTILVVALHQPILPGKSVVFDMEFQSQVPIQIRRSGRDNKEGISYSMAQWYPKLCEYDYQGWHANPYVAREFHGIWGDFDVKIDIDADYIIGGSGYLQNSAEIGYGYAADVKKKPKSDKLRWHFKAPNVHDFMWGADPDYTHTTLERKDGVVLHFFYQKGKKTKNWEKLPKIMDRAFDFINKRYGQYPYKQYSFVQGGDGGMEYPMATLITGHRELNSLVGVSVHELMHSWFQMVLGTNESLYAWMDEGFTSFATSEVMNLLKSEGLIPENEASDFPHTGSYNRYFDIASSGLEEPLTTHSDHFFSNTAYSRAAYSKGAVFLNQLEYIIGKEAFTKGLLAYFDQWKYKHPNVNDFIRVMERVSGMELDWYREYFVNTTHQVDYGFDAIEVAGPNSTKIELIKIGHMPMPIDIVLTKTDSSQQVYHIPLRMMRGEKPQEDTAVEQFVQEDWPWTNPTYELVLPVPLEEILSLAIDPSQRLADIDRSNNLLEKAPEEEEKEGDVPASSE